MDLNAILHEAIIRGASDVHLKVGVPPTIRIHGILYPLEEWTSVTREDMAAILDVLLDEHHRERFRSRMQVDLAYQTSESTRFRVNVFLQRGSRRWRCAPSPPASARWKISTCRRSSTSWRSRTVD